MALGWKICRKNVVCTINTIKYQGSCGLSLTEKFTDRKATKKDVHPKRRMKAIT